MPGVISIHELRTRSHANMIILDVHIQVNPKISVSEGHYIAEKIKAHLIKNIANIQDVMVHIDPEDDEKEPLSLNLPSRMSITRKLNKLFQQHGLPIGFKLQIHYLNGSVLLDFYYPFSQNTHPGLSAKDIKTVIKETFQTKTNIAHVNLLFVKGS